MKKIIILLLLFCPYFLLSAQNSNSLFVTTNISMSQLSSSQATKFNNLFTTNIFTSYNFVKINDFASVNDEGNILIDLPFLPYQNMIFHSKNIEYTSDNNYYWYAVANEDDSLLENSTFTLTKLKGKCTGNITFDEKSFEIYDLGDGLIVIFELNLDHINIDSCAVKNNALENTEAEHFLEDSCMLNKTRILVLYNHAAHSFDSDIWGKASTGVSQLNSIWNNSMIGNEAELAGIDFLDFYTQVDSPLTDIISLAQNPIAQNLRLTYKADIVVLLVGPNPYNDGIHGVARDIGGAFEDAYCIVDAGYAVSGKRTFVHEVTHLYNGRHDPLHDPTIGSNHGHMFYSKWVKRFTIMAVTPTKKLRIDYISNPNVTFNGKQTGMAGTRYNALHSNNFANYIAAFYKDSLSAFGAEFHAPPHLECFEDMEAYVVPHCGTAPYSYFWEYSTNGYTWVPFSTSSSVTITPPMPSSGTYFYFKVRVTVHDAMGSVYNYSRNYPMHCTEYSPKLGQTQVNDNSIIIPNPSNSTSYLKLSSTKKYKNHIVCTILNEQGIFVKEFILDISNTENIQLDLSNCVSGIYFVKLDDGINSEIIKHTILK